MRIQTLKYILVFGFLLNLFGLRSQAQNKKEGKESDLYSKKDTTKFYPPFSTDSLSSLYFETARQLWTNFVPKSGQAATVQGELIRASERLDHEIRDNGKINWNRQFVLLGTFLKETLLQSRIFPAEVRRELEQDIQRLIGDSKHIELDDAVYARITRRIVEWYWRHKEPIPHRYNEKLKI